MTGADPEIFRRLSNLVIRRYQTNARKSMLDVFQVNQDFLRLERDNLEFMFSNRNEIIAILDDADLSTNLANQFVKSSLEFTYNNNQYIHLNQDEQQRLLLLYTTYLQGMKSILESNSNFQTFESDFSLLVKTHFRELSANISRFFDRETGWQVQENIILKQVVCSEYSPDFQLGLLGLDPMTIPQPVLDLGCGKNGTLVKYLNQVGIRAIGVDRIVDDIPFMREADWFDLDFKPDTWGTVISHMAFSNHFLFHHRYKNGKPWQYARLYMQILQSLKPGGVFVYSPGLPFIEEYLPESEFSVNKMSGTQRIESLSKIASNPDRMPEVTIVKRISGNQQVP
jgi:SAM-dependent methyltransferase